MNKRSKLFATVLAAIAVALGVLCLTACNDKKEYTYRFVTYDSQTVTVKGTEGGTVKFPEVERENYAFDGWYVSADFDGEPVVSAKFTSNVTLYAKWTPVYAAVLDLDGGNIEGVSDGTLYIRLGASIADFMKEYEPVKGEYKFGGWYVGDAKLSDTAVMTENGIRLTARYMAEYTLNAYLQKPELDGYEYKENYQTGYALIEDELDLEKIVVKGFEYAEAEGDRACDIIDGDKTKNVFTMHFDRSLYEVVLNANYPDGSTDEVNEWYRFGVEFELPADAFSYDGARFMGWAEKADADYTQLIKDGKYTLQNQTTALYAQWNVGYSDLFMGYDMIFVDPDKQGAVLCRGGIDISGTYDSDRNYYIFKGKDNGDDTVTLRARLSDNHTFIFYDDRSGSYTLVDNGYLNKNVTLTIDNLNNVDYYDNTDGNQAVKKGTYTISEEGYYVAEFKDNTSFAFLIGTTSDNTPVFRIRGDEYACGVMAQMGMYYPLLSLDGFGNALYKTGAQNDAISGTYSINDDMLELVVGRETLSLKLFRYDGSELYNGFETYDKDWDTSAEGKRPYIGASGQITLDGCSNARYTRSGANPVGYDAKFTFANSVRGGYILTLVQADGTVTKFRLYEAAMGIVTIPTFDELDADYTEYYFMNQDKTIVVTPVLSVNGDTAQMYESEDGGAAYLASTGTLEKQADGSYKYIPTSFEDKAQSKYKSITVRLDTTNTNYNIYYRLATTAEDGSTEEYGVVYTQKDGAGTIEVVSGFAAYTDADGKKVIGDLADNVTFKTLRVDRRDYYYFIFDEENKQFEVLSTTPMKLTKREITENGNPNTTRSVTLTITGRTNGDGDFESIYADSDKGEIYNGYSKETVIELLGVRGVIYTFTSNDGSLKFKYYISASSSAVYFIYFATSAEVTVSELSEIDDADISTQDKTLVITDAIQSGKNLVLYVDGERETQGYVVQNAPHYAFGEYTVVTYSFYNFADEKQFDFTLAGNSLFRKCAVDEQFTSADGAKLELDGATHKARYTYADGARYSDSDYLTDTDEGMRTVIMYFDDAYHYFDIMNEDAKTFELRGDDAGLYILVSNGNIQTVADPDDAEATLIATVELDGHGKAALSYLKEGATATEGTYINDGDVYTVTVGDKTYVGKLGALTVGNNQYRAFYVRIDNTIAGTYLDKTSLAVLTLDDVGNVVKYTSRGTRDQGTYLRLDDDLFYYVNSASTDGAIYTVNKLTGEITASDYHATYYSDGFGSVVFYLNGVVLVNNDSNNAAYFNYEGGKLYSYTYDPDAPANKYGYVKSERFVVKTENSVNYIELDGVKYYEFDGKYITLEDADGATLTFQPTGNATFTVAATYRAKDSTEDTTLYVAVAYNDEGQVQTFLANYENRSIAGSRNAYTTFVSWDVELHFVDKTFVYDSKLATFDYTSYDNTYIQMYQTYGAAFMQLFGARLLGMIYIVGTCNADGSVDYAVSGQFNYVTVEVENESGERVPAYLTFTDGKLAQAGYYSSQFGHMFTVEFTGNDEQLYHLNFYMLPSGVYAIHSLTRVKSTVDCGDDCYVYSEEFVYSYFNVPNGKTDPETGKQLYYASGDDYLPSLKYKGKIISVAAVNGIDDAADADGVYTWEFMSVEYFVDHLEEYSYVYKFKLEDTSESDDVVVPQSLVRFGIAGYTDGDNMAVVYEDADGNINRIYSIYVSNVADIVKSSEYNAEDGTYTVTTESGKTFTVKFTDTVNEEGESVRTVTIAAKQAESSDDNA